MKIVSPAMKTPISTARPASKQFQGLTNSTDAGKRRISPLYILFKLLSVTSLSPFYLKVTLPQVKLVGGR
jgi:hypothetical protein